MYKTKSSILGLSFGALGIVFGDIGTSPLYALSAVFSKVGLQLPITTTNVYGVVSLILWSITLVVSVKFIGFIMRADNEGEGGIMALVAQVKSTKLSTGYQKAFILTGLIGVALFYGDSTITPAISVLSAVEGLKVISPSLAGLVVPVTVAIISMLFAIQKYGTGVISKLFGPVMLGWFMAIAAGGSWQIWHHPGIVTSLSPLVALYFLINHPALGFVAMGAVVLAITGAEALYADMGHFGRGPIAKAWFIVVFPSLALCYMGEGALILTDPASASHPLVALYPAIIQFPVVILATLATVIASQAVISGAFSLTRQAVQLNYLPRLLIRHTSTQTGGQIYVPFVNLLLFIMVSVLVIAFGSSDRLANAYGIAVSGTLLTDSLLYLVIIRKLRQTGMITLVIALLTFLPIDLLFVGSSLPKLLHGGWLPVLLGVVVFVIIDTWRRGQMIVGKERQVLEGPLQQFVDKVHTQRPPVIRIPGVAVYIGHHEQLAPLALHATLDDLHELHERVVIVTVQVATAAHVPEARRAVIDELRYQDGISHVQLTYGFHDVINIPEALRFIRHRNSDLDFDITTASYFISLSKVVLTRRHNMAVWRKRFFCLMDRNALSSSDYYILPIGRTVEMRSLIKL